MRGPQAQERFTQRQRDRAAVLDHYGLAPEAMPFLRPGEGADIARLFQAEDLDGMLAVRRNMSVGVSRATRAKLAGELKRHDPILAASLDLDDETNADLIRVMLRGRAAQAANPDAGPTAAAFADLSMCDRFTDGDVTDLIRNGDRLVVDPAAGLVTITNRG